MAVQWLIRTAATSEQVVHTFEAAFFNPRRPKFTDRFKLADPVARNASVKLAWRKTSVEGATIGATDNSQPMGHQPRYPRPDSRRASGVELCRGAQLER